MTRLQWLVLIAIVALLISLSWVEVVRGEGPCPARTQALAEVSESLDVIGY